MNPTILDRLLSESVVYPVLGLALVGALVAVAARPRKYTPASDF